VLCEYNGRRELGPQIVILSDSVEIPATNAIITITNEKYEEASL